VDALGAAGPGAGVAALVPTVRAIVAFGLAGVLQHVAKELQHPTFTPVSQVGEAAGEGVQGGGQQASSSAG
jgi:hypothetical protein